MCRYEASKSEGSNVEEGVPQKVEKGWNWLSGKASKAADSAADAVDKDKDEVKVSSGCQRNSNQHLHVSCTFLLEHAGLINA